MRYVSCVIVAGVLALPDIMCAVWEVYSRCEEYTRRVRRERAAAEHLEVLRTEPDPDEVLFSASQICLMREPKAVKSLVEQLKTPAFLSKLDSPRRYKRVFWSNLRVTRLLEEIGKMQSPLGEEALLALSVDEVFMNHADRQEALRRGFGHIANPSPKLLDFLASKGTSLWAVHHVVDILARMQSTESCELIEKLFNAPKYAKDPKEVWFTTSLLEHRTDYRIVGLYRRLLSSPIEHAKLRNVIVQSLFDYRPEDWFGHSEGHPTIPQWKDADTWSLEGLLEIAELTKKQDLSPETREGVRKAVKEINAILAEREKKK